MIGLLARVVVGVAVGALAAGTAYAVYKVITKQTIVPEIINRLKNIFWEKEYDETKEDDALKQQEEWLNKACWAKIKKKEGHTVSLDILDEDSTVIEKDIDISGDEVSEDIKQGDLISLVV